MEIDQRLGAAGDGPVRSVGLTVFATAFVENVGSNSIEVFNGRLVNDCIQKEDEVQDSFMANVEKVETGDGKIINDRGFQAMEKFLSFEEEKMVGI
jgi:hypothetical protein